MKRKLSSVIIDKIFTVLTVFIISLIWIRYYEHNIYLICLYSSLSTLIICSILYIIYKKKQKNLKFSQKERKNIENLTYLLTFQTKQETLKIFYNALKNKNLEVVKKNNFLIFNNSILTPFYTKTFLDENDIISLVVKVKQYKLNKKNLIICAKQFNDNAVKLANNIIDFKIYLYNETETYLKLFKSLNLTYGQQKIKITKKEKFKNLLNVAFNKTKFKGYLISATILLIGSYFLRYNLYYLIMSTILLIFAFFSYFNHFFNKKQENLFESNLNSKENINKKNLLK